MTVPSLPPDIPKPLDDELLAWAAGFFDGEGTTMARTYVARPGYFQLELSVPQSGPDGTPEVLLKFKRAMLEMGAIRAETGGMHAWKLAGLTACETALGLIWRWLGSVKRAQALTAIEIVRDQYTTGSRKQRAPRSAADYVPHEARSRTTSEALATAWLAGFMDAEGYFGNPKRYRRKDGSTGLCVRASASQHGEPGEQPEVLRRLQRLLGGRIERHGEPDDYKWVMEGLLNVDWVLEELRPWLGTVKVTQAERALDAAEASRQRGSRQWCKRGHRYDRLYTTADGQNRARCNSCARLRDRTKRLERGGHMRLVRDQPADATRRYRVK